MSEKKKKYFLVIGKYRYVEGIENSPWLYGPEKVLVEWIVENAKRTNLFFDDGEELEKFREEISNFAVELYRKKYNKEETNEF